MSKRSDERDELQIPRLIFLQRLSITLTKPLFQTQNLLLQPLPPALLQSQQAHPPPHTSALSTLELGYALPPPSCTPPPDPHDTVPGWESEGGLATGQVISTLNGRGHDLLLLQETVSCGSLCRSGHGDTCASSTLLYIQTTWASC